MKYLNMVLATMFVAVMCFAAQDTTLTNREVRDPIQLEAWLEANASDAQTRISAIEGGTATVTLATDSILVGNDSSNQTAMAVTGDVTISQDGTNVTTAIAAGVVVNADVATNAAIASSKLADDVVRSGDATSQQLMEAATIAADANTDKVYTFNTGFSVAPVVVACYADDSGDVQPVYIKAVTTSNVTVTAAVTNVPVNLIAIGQK